MEKGQKGTSPEKLATHRESACRSRLLEKNSRFEGGKIKFSGKPATWFIMLPAIESLQYLTWHSTTLHSTYFCLFIKNLFNAFEQTLAH
jgi:hypothetical protein